jgi:hypothetical protein
MVIENMWNKEIFYSNKFCFSSTGTEMLRGELNTLDLPTPEDPIRSTVSTRNFTNPSPIVSSIWPSQNHFRTSHGLPKVPDDHFSMPYRIPAEPRLAFWPEMRNCQSPGFYKYTRKGTYPVCDRSLPSISCTCYFGELRILILTQYQLFFQSTDGDERFVSTRPRLNFICTRHFLTNCLRRNRLCYRCTRAASWRVIEPDGVEHHRAKFDEMYTILLWDRILSADESPELILCLPRKTVAPTRTETVKSEVDCDPKARLTFLGQLRPPARNFGTLGDSRAHSRLRNYTEDRGGASKTESVISYWSISSHISPVINLRSHFTGILGLKFNGEIWAFSENRVLRTPNIDDRSILMNEYSK